MRLLWLPDRQQCPEIRVSDWGCPVTPDARGIAAGVFVRQPLPLGTLSYFAVTESVHV